MKRALRILAILTGLTLALVGTTAVAAWLSIGSASVVANATSVAQANTPVATRGAGTVGLSWAASTLTSGAPVGGYRVLRHDGPTTTQVCAVSAPTLSCTDGSPVATAVTYGVVATIGTHWQGPESTRTSFTYDDVAPVTTANVSPTPNAATWNRTDVSVTLTATDSGIASGVDHVSHTLDGGALVTTAGATVTFPVSGAGNHPVTFYAVDAVGNIETTNILTVRIDPSAPTTVVTHTPAANGAGWNNTNVALDFTATDSGASGVQSVTVDGVTTNGATASKTVSAEGTTTVSYFATDVADNVEGTKTATVKIDKTAPTASISPAGSATWIKQASQSVTVSGSDGLSGVASVSYAIDGGATVTTTGSSVTFSVGQGDHTVTYFATDAAGNQQTQQSAAIRVDNVAPVSSVSPASSTSVWRSSGAVTFSGTDATSGVASFVVSVDGGSAQTIPAVGGSASLSPALGDGTHTVTYKAVDNAGNVESPAKSATIKVDTVSASIANLMNGDLSYDNNSNGTGSWNKDACGGNKVCATITDAASGVKASTITFNLTGTSLANNGKCWNGSTFTSGTSCAVAMNFNAGSGVASSTVNQSNMLDGTYDLTIHAEDNAGNVREVTVTITVA